MQKCKRRNKQENTGMNQSKTKSKCYTVCLSYLNEHM